MALFPGMRRTTAVVWRANKNNSTAPLRLLDECGPFHILCIRCAGLRLSSVTPSMSDQNTDQSYFLLRRSERTNQENNDSLHEVLDVLMIRTSQRESYKASSNRRS
ncbi:hypothetical protein WMY93_004063 [Mugilogobius chulae]|uniref:Uncharacterized protein n=1 Tax=Mugilogobius chulae TaxID=88201 RepID=A0AAW0PMR4_9GOBI